MNHLASLDKLSGKFNEAVVHAFDLLSQSLKVRTFFVGRTTENTFSISKVFTKIDGCLIKEGDSIPIQKSY